MEPCGGTDTDSPETSGEVGSTPPQGRNRPFLSFADVNAWLWGFPTTTADDGGGDGSSNVKSTRWAAWHQQLHALQKAPEEMCGLFGRYFFTWMNPSIDLAAAECLEESEFPPPRRSHTARMCGSALSRAFRDDEMKRGRHCWERYIEAVSVTGEGNAPTCVPNALSKVRLKSEPSVHGRLRWVGYVRASDDARRLYAGVEWDADSALPAYRSALGNDGGYCVHDGCVHGVRLFHAMHSTGDDAPRCTCEPVGDVDVIAGDGSTPRPSLLAGAMLRVFKNDILSIAPPMMWTTVAYCASPLLLKMFVAFLEDNNDEHLVARGLYVGLVFSVVKLWQPMTSKKEEQRQWRTAGAFRSSVTALIFEKCLSISPDAAADPAMSAGRVLTMASSDVENIKQMPIDVFFLFLAPALIVFFVTYLCILVGWSGVCGLAVFLVVIPCQAVVARWQSRLQEELSACVDRRLRIMNEMLSGIRVVKTMGWEPKFLHSLEEEARAEEQQHRKKLQLCETIMTSMEAAPVMMVTLVLLAYTYSGHTVTAQVVFPVISIIGSLSFPIMMVPEAITTVVKFYISCRRVSRFLECDDRRTTARDIEEMFSNAGGEDVGRTERGSGRNMGTAYAAALDNVYAIAFTPKPVMAWRAGPPGGKLQRLIHRLMTGSSRRVPVELQWVSDSTITEDAGDGDGTVIAVHVPGDGGGDGSASDSDDDDEPSTVHAMVPKTLLSDVDLTIARGTLTVVIGPTGAGKSTLLSTILGNLCVDEGGRVWTTRNVAYVPQQPWIMQDTIRANITFLEGGCRGGGTEGTDGGASSASDGNSLMMGVRSPLYGRHVRARAPEALVCGRAAFEREERLQSALRCCQMETDLHLLAAGLETEIGERGVNLSGGQKARVSLARAVYADKELYLLDDPLSAVDAHVGHRLVKDVIVGALKEKTRVLVTHQLHVLPHADVVVVMRGGCIAFSGSYAAYCASSVRADVEQELKAEEHTEEGGAVGTIADKELSPDTTRETFADKPPAACEQDHTCSCGSTFSEDEGAVPAKDNMNVVLDKDVTVAADAICEDQQPEVEDAGEGKLILEEEKELGHVPLAVYKHYLAAGGGIQAVFYVLFFFTVTIGFYVLSNIWLSLWATNAFPNLSTWYYLLGYFVLGHIALITYPLRDWSTFCFCRRAAGRMHNELARSVVSGTMRFFDRTPLGRVLNRFSKDIYTLDDQVNYRWIVMIDLSFYLVSLLSITAYSTPLAIPVIVLVVLGFVKLLRFYTRIIREVRRRSSIAQSPMFSLLGEILSGRQTIEAYDKSKTIFHEALRRLDTVYSCTYTERVMNLWLSTRVEYLGMCVVLSVVIIGIAERISHKGGIPSNRERLISLTLTMCLDLYWALAELVREAALVEASMNSAQRVVHYIKEIEHEDLELMDDLDGNDVCTSVVVEGQPDSDGANTRRGTLELRGASMRYRDGLPLVLRDVSFTIGAGEKVGIVGRTGSGKSSLLLTFMRMVELSGGEMIVSGRGALTYSLRELRKLFALIPQDPLLFEGTVRSNVDPFLESTDTAAARALELVGLCGSCDATTNENNNNNASASARSVGDATTAAGGTRSVSLDDVVSEGGQNFSVGQRQLLCLARALLKKGSEFILMDEATANIDPELDVQVQAVVRAQFRDYTVITIAHRLHTVAGYDHVLVMDAGRVVESGPPRELVLSHHSVFRGMVARTGGNEEDAIAAFLNDCQ